MTRAALRSIGLLAGTLASALWLVGGCGHPPIQASAACSAHEGDACGGDVKNACSCATGLVCSASRGTCQKVAAAGSGGSTAQAGSDPTLAGHGGTGERSSDSSDCSLVLPSNYDQSCVSDTDCVLVGKVTACPAQACAGCMNDAINAVDADRYDAAFTQAIADSPNGGVCACPCEGIAVCRAGKCQAGYCAPSAKDTLPTCTNAGGRCAYKANTTCDGIGPTNSCAFDDEVCCL
jgi:hypothetical protein